MPRELSPEPEHKPHGTSSSSKENDKETKQKARPVGCRNGKRAGLALNDAFLLDDGDDSSSILATAEDDIMDAEKSGGADDGASIPLQVKVKLSASKKNGKHMFM